MRNDVIVIPGNDIQTDTIEIAAIDETNSPAIETLEDVIDKNRLAIFAYDELVVHNYGPNIFFLGCRAYGMDV